MLDYKVIYFLIWYSDTSDLNGNNIMPFFLGTFKIQRKINTVQIFCIKYLFCWSAAKIFYFPSQEGQNGAPLVEKSVSLVLQVARNCRLTEVGKRFMPRSYALALASGEHDC